MQISLDKFKQIVGEATLHTAGLHAIPRAHKIAIKQYCDKLTARSACSGDCNTCALQLKAAADWLAPKNINNPYALFTWLMKNAFARTMEKMAQRPQFKPEVNTLGEATERDALDILLETFDD